MRWSLLVVLSLFSCATAEDDQVVNWGDPPKKTDTGVAPTTDTSTSSTDTGTPTTSTDSSMPSEDTSSPPPDTSVDDTGDFDAGPPPDTSPPPFDTGPTTGTCMWCATGSCPTAFSDYACLLNCLSDGHLDCHYDPAASMPCTCVD